MAFRFFRSGKCGFCTQYIVYPIKTYGFSIPHTIYPIKSFGFCSPHTIYQIKTYSFCSPYTNTLCFIGSGGNYNHSRKLAAGETPHEDNTSRHHITHTHTHSTHHHENRRDFRFGLSQAKAKICFDFVVSYQSIRNESIDQSIKQSIDQSIDRE